MALARLCSLLLAAALAASQTQAARLDSRYTPNGGNSWNVELVISGDGSPAQISGFTTYFAETLFENLELLSSPGHWDSLVIQPDPGLPAAGYLDALVLDTASSLGSGQSQGGFVLRFSYLGGGAPTSLPFEIVDTNFQVLFSGQSQVAVVPEPALWLQLLGGLAALGRLTQRRRPA